DHGLTVFAGPESVYALDTQRGVLATVDPRTLGSRGTPVTVSTQVKPYASTLDDDGRLWILDDVSGDLVRLDGGERRVRHSAVRPGAGSLALAEGRPVLLDGQRGTAATLDPADGSVETTTALDLRANDRPFAVGAAHDRRLYVLAS